MYCNFLSQIRQQFIKISSLYKQVLDEDIEALVLDELHQPDSIWSFGDLQVTCGTLGFSTATVKLFDADGTEHVACSVGNGPVYAAYKAVDLIVKIPVTLLEYSLAATPESIDAIATTCVLIRGENVFTSMEDTGKQTCRTFSGSGSEVDIVTSSVRAYVNALNKMLAYNKKHVQKVVDGVAGNSHVSALND